LRDLPEQIATLEQRAAHLSQDLATAKAHAGDPLTIAGRKYAKDEVVDALAARMKQAPFAPSRSEQFSLGEYHGLSFGLSLSLGQTPEVYVQGAVHRRGRLSREFQGPRAVLNAVERVIEGYAAERDRTERDLAIDRSKLRDYRERKDGPFPHEAYMQELALLRIELENALCAVEGTCNTSEIVERFKTLKATHMLEAPPRTSERKAASIEESVTTRIMHRVQEEVPAVPGDAPQGHTPTPRTRQRAPQNTQQMCLF
jgi:hypothetical protein